MESVANLQGDLPILYILLAILILLALLAAIGAWVRGGGLKREDAENLFSEAREKHREELIRLETALEQSRKESAEALSKSQNDMAMRIRELNEQVVRSRNELESAVSLATKKQGDALSDELQSVTRMITEAERRTGTSIEDMNASLQGLQSQVKLAGDSVSRSLSEMARQQRDQKAQSTIQLCDALITSLGTLKSTISTQITHSGNVVNAEAEEERPAEVSAPPAWQSPFDDDVDSDANQTDSEQPEPQPYSDTVAADMMSANDVNDNDEVKQGDSCAGASEVSADFDTHAIDTNHDGEPAEEQDRQENDRTSF